MSQKQTSNKTRRPILDVAVGLLARREHSEAELRQKLKQRKYPENEISEALVQLKSYNYLDDERFVEAFVSTRQSRGQGPLKIRMELNQRGVAANLIDQHINERDQGWFDAAITVYQKKFGKKAPSDYAEKVKAWRFIQSRGFNQDHFEKAINYASSAEGTDRYSAEWAE